MRKQTKAYILTLMVVAFWATAASAFKIALRDVTPYTLLFFSTLFSSMCLFAILCGQSKLGLLLKSDRRSLAKAALLGACPRIGISSQIEAF